MLKSRSACLGQTVLGATPLDVITRLHGTLILRYRQLDQGVALRIDRLRKRRLQAARIDQIHNELEQTLSSLTQIQNVLPAADAERLDEMGKRLEWILGRLRSS